MTRTVTDGTFLLLAVVVQVTWLPHVSLLGTDPNLALLAVVGWTWVRGSRAGLLCALAAGLLLDFTASGPLGIHAIALLAGAYLSGLVAGRLQEGRILVPAAAAALASLAYGLIVIGGGETLGQPLPPAGVARVLLLGGALYNAALMPLVLLALRRLDSMLPSSGVELW